MGCCFSSSAPADEYGTQLAEGGFLKSARRVVWSSQTHLTAPQLEAMRAEFWDTQPHYGGDESEG